MGVKPKYRRLTHEELTELENEFINFLIINGIAADDWVKIKEEEPDKTEDIVVLFSDSILEGVMRKIRFLEHRTPSDIKTFQCLEDKMILVGMHAENPSVDFTEEDFFTQAATNPPEGIEVFTSEKSYGKVREMELFGMIESGCQISNGQSFKAISLALASQ